MLSLLLGLFISFAQQPDIPVKSSLQADRHIQAILDGNETDFNYWFLAKMAQSSQLQEEQIFSRLAELEQKPVSDTGHCFISAFIRPADPPGRLNRTAARLMTASKCTNSEQLGLASVYETNPADRRGIIDQLSHLFDGVDENEILQAHLELATDGVTGHDEFYQVRPFLLADSYLFDRTTTPHPGSKLDTLVLAWKAQLEHKSSFGLPIDFAKLLVIGHYNHAVKRDFTANFEYLSRLEGNQRFSDITEKHVFYKRVVFSATIQGYYQTALRFYRNDLIPLSRRIMDDEEYLKVQLDYGYILFRLGDVRGALSVYQSVYNHELRIQDPRYISPLINNLAVSYLNAGFFDQYLSLQVEAYEQALNSGDIVSKLRILNNLYIYHWRNQDWNNALRYLDQALDVARENSLYRELADIYVLYATYYRERRQDYVLALEYIGRALELIDAETSFRIYTNTMAEMALTLQADDNPAQAYEIREQILNQARQRHDTQVELEMLSELLPYYVSEGAFERADNMADSLRIMTDESLDYRLSVMIANAVFIYDYSTGNGDTAIMQLEETGQSILTTIRNSSDLQSGLMRIEPGFMKTFSLLVDYYYTSGDMHQAVIWLDEIKNLSKAPFVNSNLLKSSLLSEEEFLLDSQLTIQIDQIRSRLIHATDQERLQLNTQLLQLIDEKNRLNNKILNSFTTKPLNIRLLQQHVRRGEQILSYTSLNNMVYVVRITRNDVHISRLELTDYITELAVDIVNDLKQTRSDLHKLYEFNSLLVAPYLLPGKSLLTLVPDDFLYHIPVDILPMARTPQPFNYGSARYLIESHQIAYHNSLSDILLSRSENRNTGRFSLDFLGVGVSDFTDRTAVVGGSRHQNVFEGTGYPSQTTAEPMRRVLSQLPFAREEIATSYTLLDWLPRREKLLDSLATKPNFMSRAAGTRILHIASHSEVYNTDPLFSVIHLHHGMDAGAAYGNLVYAYELFDLNLDSQLIVLSSCDSGSGTFVQGSGIIGLGRALNFAGAESLILNMWSIRDHTAAELMTGFYRHLGTGSTKDAALRQSKLDYINNKSSDPAVWGSLILFGDHTAIVTHTLERRLILLTLLLLIGGVLLYLGYRR